MSYYEKSISSKIYQLSSNAQLVMVITFAILFWVVFHWKALDYYWFNDDLHLIRTFSETELRSILTGPWDPDMIETPGYRPFTTLFNHVRYMFLGESPLRHRMFLLILMACLLWVVAKLMLRCGMGLSQIFLSYLILVSTKSFTNDVVWISDGIHVFANLLVFVSILMFLKYVEVRSILLYIGSLLLALVAFLTREETIVLVILAPSFLVFETLYKRQPILQRILSTDILVYSGILSISVLLLFIVRAQIVPNLSTISINITSLKKLLEFLKWSILIVGDFISPGKNVWTVQTGLPILSMITILYLVSLMLMVAVFAKIAQFIIADYILALSFMWIVVSTPGMVMLRANLLFLPTLFFLMLISRMGVELFHYLGIHPNLGQHQRFYLRSFVIVFFLISICGSVTRAVYQRSSMSPSSITTIIGEYQWIYGERSKMHPTIPHTRLDYLKSKLEKLDISATTIQCWNDGEYPAMLDCVKYTGMVNGEYLFMPAVGYIMP